AWLFEAREQDHGGDDERLVAGFAVGREARSFENAGGDFAFLAAYGGDVGGEAVHVEGFALLGRAHELFGAFPAFELGVVGEGFFLARFELVLFTAAEETRALLHHAERGPALGVDDVGVLERFFHAEGALEGTAGFFGMFLSS